MDTEGLYKELKPLLFSLSYHILGSATDAEDMVQEAFLTLEKTPEENINHVKAYLCKMVTNRSIDLLRSAGRQRETYVGPWLPEPIMTETGFPGDSDDPLGNYLLKESLSTAYLLLLQNFSETERVVFLLREVFQYSYNDISKIASKSSANCRQIYHRTKKVMGNLPKENISSNAHKGALSEKFALALMNGNINQLLDVLTSEAVLYTDGGGKVQAALRPILGPDRIVMYFNAIYPKVPKGFTCTVHEINGQTGVIIKIGEITFTVVTFQFQVDRISDVYIVMNPEKLTKFNDGEVRNIWEMDFEDV
ncbi:RNA polymerase sigma-70 factor [Sporosarcina sp. ACRSL]|uniref:RNA polymerase sigma-70 factor n=1 Tax=Sporosarcina sp. ACRSL TaxID=2918215 RepID=UPI001EF4C926|nr:RNA polymerase sigma-70 factor [Sporosarcina sp. ACRSL]MCG7346261.1 RNA polymerase sigma-70 factor [Sporosarcina sp. ACRSL]